MREIEGKIYYSRPEAAKLIGVCRNQVNKWTKSGRLKSIRLPKSEHEKEIFLISRKELNEFIFKRAAKFRADKLFRGKGK